MLLCFQVDEIVIECAFIAAIWCDLAVHGVSRIKGESRFRLGFVIFSIKIPDE